jgi:integrase
LATVRGAIKARDRALSAPELRAYWQRVQALADPHRAALVLHLLTGCQRVEQLARATVADLDRRVGTLRLMDSKGRRALPWVHVVPLLPPALAAVAAMRRGAGPEDVFVWTLTHGKSGCSYSAAHDLVSKIAAAMVEAGEAREPFTLGDLRRSVETLLAGFGVPQEVRAQLQSHGLGSLQARHYDRHSYAEEKTDALRLIWATVDADAEQADRAERERLAKLAAGGTVLAFRRPA